MYPTLADLIKDLFGIELPLPFPTFGFFVALAFLTAAYFFTKELKRKERLGWLSSTTVKEKIGEKASVLEILSNALIGFIIGFKLVGVFTNYDLFAENPQSFIFSGEGNFLGGLLAAAFFGWSKYREKEKQKLEVPKMVDREVHPHEWVGNMTLIAAVGGILGAKIFHNLENINDFMADPWGALTSFSGLSIYGGLIVGGLSVLYYAAKKGLKWVHVADACAPGLMAAYGVGRIGCQLSGDGDWGLPNDSPKPEWMSFLPDWMWAFDYPGNVLGVNLKEDFERMGYESLTGNAWPTPFYETVMAGIIFLILWNLRKRIAIPGFIFSLYLSLNGIERFLIEKIRINPDYDLGFIQATQAEIIAVLMFVFGIVGMYYFSKHKEKYIPNTANSAS
jgi:prolipoprotein diacylglyceryltransferase